MNWFSSVVVYVIIWWIVFFMTLPVGARSPTELGETVEVGHAESAPIQPRLWFKAAITTVISAVLWGIAYYLITSDALSFRSL